MVPMAPTIPPGEYTRIRMGTQGAWRVHGAQEMGLALCPTPTNQIQRKRKKIKQKKGRVQLPAGMMRVDFMGAGASDQEEAGTSRSAVTE